MIDWAIIISTAVNFMTASITKAGEVVAGKVGEELFKVIRKKFKGDKEAREILSNFQEKPSRYESALVDVLKEKAKADKSFRDEIKRIIENNLQSLDNTKTTIIVNGTGNAVATGDNSTAKTNIIIKDE